MKENINGIIELLKNEDDSFDDHGSMIKLRKFLDRRKLMKKKRQDKLNQLLKGKK